MMNYRLLTGLIIMIVLSVLLSSCGSSDVVSHTGDPADIAALKKEIDDSAFFADTLLDEAAPDASGDINLSRSGALLEQPPMISMDGTVLPPHFWWRKRDELLNRDIDIHVENDVANVSVTSNIAGRLLVDNIRDGKLDPWEKPFQDTIRRYAAYIKNNEQWRLLALSPVEIVLSDPSKQTTGIKKITVSAGDEILWEASSPDILFDFPDNIPVLAPGTLVKVEAEISNSKTNRDPAVFAYLHRPGGRDFMWDNGNSLFGDSIANDGIFTRLYLIGPVPGRFFAVVDVIDYDTFLNETTDYNSTAWGMPYIVAGDAAE